MGTIIKAVPVVSTIRRTGDTVTLRTKVSDIDPATVRATVIDGELVVTAHVTPPVGPGAATTALGDGRHRLIDLGPRLQPV